MNYNPIMAPMRNAVIGGIIGTVLGEVAQKDMIEYASTISRIEVDVLFGFMSASAGIAVGFAYDMFRNPWYRREDFDSLRRRLQESRRE